MAFGVWAANGAEGAGQHDHDYLSAEGEGLVKDSRDHVDIEMGTESHLITFERLDFENPEIATFHCQESRVQVLLHSY